jgi:signal transduction histidine kinase
MAAARRLDALDTRMVFLVYAVLAGLAGLLLIAWGPLWFGAHLPGLPWGKAALIRIVGSMLVAAACFAVAVARVDDLVARGGGLAWFGWAHLVVAIMVETQRSTVLEPRLREWAVWVLMVAANMFFFAWLQARFLDGRRTLGTLLTLFGNPASSSTQQLRSAYEQQIREAAGQQERHRLARDLHDAIKQEIFVVQTAAATVEARFDSDPDGARSALAQVRAAAREAMAEMEAMLDQLRAAPLEPTGLVEVLRKQCEALGFRTGARVEFQFGTLPSNEALAPGAPQAIFRVAQEALANAGRHARAANVKVSLNVFGQKLELMVRDDGSGFDANRRASGMGIRNMRERATEYGGEFEIDSMPGRGTTVRFWVPVASYYAFEDYQKQIWILCVVAAICTAFAIWRQWPGALLAVAISIVALGQAVSGYRRTRARREISR